MRSCRIRGSQLLLKLEILPSFLDSLLISCAEGEHKASWFLLSSYYLFGKFGGKMLLMLGSTIALLFGLACVLSVFFLNFGLFLLLLGEKEILGATGTGQTRFIIIIEGLIEHLILLLLILIVKVIACCIGYGCGCRWGCRRRTILLIN